MIKIFYITIKNKLSKFSRRFMNHVKNNTVPVSFFYSDQFQIFSLYNLDHLKTKNQRFEIWNFRRLLILGSKAIRSKYQKGKNKSRLQISKVKKINLPAARYRYVQDEVSGHTVFPWRQNSAQLKMIVSEQPTFKQIL